MENDIQQILLTQEQIQNRIRELGQVLTAEYADKNPVIIGVLKGVVVSVRSRCPASWTSCGCPPIPEPIPPGKCWSVRM